MPALSSSCNRSTLRCTLPVVVIGNASTNSISFGYSYGASRSRTCSCKRRHKRLVAAVARRQHDIGLDQRAAFGVGLGHHRRVRDRGMLHEAVFDLARADAITRGLEHVVGAALVPEIAIDIHHRGVAGAAPAVVDAAGELRARGFVVAPVAEEEHGVGMAVDVAAMHGHLAGRAARALAPVVVDHGDAVARVGAAHAAGARGPTGQRSAIAAGRDAAVADDVVDFGLAEHLVDRDAQRVAAPVEDRVADRFARAHDRAQHQAVARTRARLRLHHRLQRGGEEEGVGDGVALHQLERAFGMKAPVVRDDRLAEVQRGQQRVHQAAGPRPVGGAPEDIARLREPVLAGDEAGQVADQRALRDQRTLRCPGGAAGVDQYRRIVGPGGDDRCGHRWCEQRVCPVDVALPHRVADSDDVFERRARGAHVAQGVDRGFVCDGDARCAVLQAKRHRIGAEKDRQRHRDRAQALAGDVRHRGLEALRHHDRDAVAVLHAAAYEARRQAARGGVEVTIGEARGFALFVLVDDRDRVGRAARPARGTDFGDVELRGHAPAEVTVQLRVGVERRGGA